MSNWSKIEDAIKNRILMLDGAMGTMLKPSAVEKVHNQFLAAGADLIETNSFNATTISQADYDMSDLATEIAREAAKLARKCADEWTAKTPEKPDEVMESYVGQIEAMIDIVDAVLIETVFDTLNCKAAIAATKHVFDKVGYEKPRSQWD